MIFPGFPGVLSFFQVFQVEWEPCYIEKTRMHSSKMRTVRCSGRLGRGGGVCLGGVSARGVYTPHTVDRILDTHLWKHYLSTTTVADGNYLVSPGSWLNNFHLPSESTSLIISCNSASVGFCPNDLITVPSSFDVVVPSPSLSNKEKASLNSEKYIKMFFIFDA